jgi:uncharacterized repeat protein (TIGR02543 family)
MRKDVLTKNLFSRGAAAVMIALLAACTNPFFEDLLGIGENVRAAPSGGYTVTFKYNDGTDMTVAAKTAAAPAAAIGAEDFPANPGRTGYAFTGWNTESDGTGSVFDAATPVAADITVYAQWTEVPPGSYTVIFERNDGSMGIHRIKTAQAGASLGGDFPGDPARTGYDFGGWNTEADGTGSAFTASTPVNADITVYAQWIQTGNAGITFTTDAGEGAFSQTNFSVYKTGNPHAQTIAIADPGAYTGWQWMVGMTLKGTGDSITINADDYAIGEYDLTLKVTKDGFSWSKGIQFTVFN